MNLIIREACNSDYGKTWPLIRQVIQRGDTYVFNPDSSREKMTDIWFSPDKYTYVAEFDHKIVGTFWLKPNQPDLGSHIANAAYMVHPENYGKGIGQKMAEFSLTEAKRLGFTAIQFNLVVKSNEAAIALWKKTGFDIIGEIPDAFNHKSLGFINAYIMYKKL